MSKERRYKITLRDFILSMREGFGFARPGRVKKIGLALDVIIPQDIRNIEVEVIYKNGHCGWGPNGYYFYTWTVRGVRINSQNATLGPDMADIAFGRKSDEYFRILENGFEVGYES